MLLIVKLLSFKRYNYPFTSAEKMNNKCNMFILSLLAMKLYRSFLAFFVRFWRQMQCIVSQPLPFLVLQNAYLVAKIQIYIGLEQTIILKILFHSCFFDNFNRTTSCITVNELQTMGNVNMVYII